jgi:peroxiredoxin
MNRTLILLTLMAGASVALAAADVGKPAPEFTATDINGKTIKLSDFQGKIVVLESYNQDCPYCHNQYKSGAMQELQQQLTNQGVVFLVVNSVSPSNPSHRSPEAARQEWAEEKLHATAWIDDSSGELGHKYGMRTTPHMFVIDSKGMLVYQGAIDDRPSPSGDPRTARNYVREAVKALQAGQKVETTETKPYGCGVKYGS